MTHAHEAPAQGPAPESLLAASGLTCSRGDRLLFRDLSLRVDAGQALQVRGPNGCGKTTLLRILCGLTLPEDGTIRWRGRALASHDPDYLRELRDAGDLLDPATKIAARAAYHTPCHLKALEIGTPAVDVLAAVPGLEVVPVAEGCCGMAGTFGMRRKHYALSMEMGRRLFERLKAEPFDFALTDCSTCALQIADGTGLVVHHPIKVLWAAYGLGSL